MGRTFVSKVALENIRDVETAIRGGVCKGCVQQLHLPHPYGVEGYQILFGLFEVLIYRRKIYCGDGDYGVKYRLLGETVTWPWMVLDMNGDYAFSAVDAVTKSQGLTEDEKADLFDKCFIKFEERCFVL